MDGMPTLQVSIAMVMVDVYVNLKSMIHKFMGLIGAGSMDGKPKAYFEKLRLPLFG